MSTNGSYYDPSLSGLCEPDHNHEMVYTVLDSAFYEDNLPPLHSFPLDYSNEYVTNDPTAMSDFNEISTYYPSSPALEERDYSPPCQAPTPEPPAVGLALQPAIYLNTAERSGENVPTRPRGSPSPFGLEVPWSPADSVHSFHSIHSVDSFSSAHSQHSLHPVTTTPKSERRELSPEPVFHLTPAHTPQRHRQTNSLSSLSELQQPELHHTQPHRYWTPIAPNPIGLRQLHAQKHSLSDDDWESSPNKRIRRSSPPSPNIELTEEDNLLLRLKDDDALTWKEIATRFQDEKGKSYQVPALQMRMKRLRERMRVWTEGDIQALRLAHEYWMNQKFDIIATKMLEFGSTEKWSPKRCSRKWSELSWTPDIYSHPMMRTPTFSTSYTASPIEGPIHGFYAQVPITSA